LFLFHSVKYFLIENFEIMKNIILYMFSLVLAGMVFFSCEDQYADQEVADPTIYEQEALQDVDFQTSVKTNPLAITEDNIDNTLEFISLTSVPDLVDSSATVEYKVTLSDDADFTTYSLVEVTLVSDELNVDYKLLNDTLKALNSTLESHTAYARVLAYIVSDGTMALYTTENMPFDVTTYNYAPVAVNDTVIAIMNQQLTYDVIANDSDLEGDELTLISAEGASNGTVTISDSTILYTPNTDYSGEDELTYTVSDGNSTSTATVFITITEQAELTQFWLVGSYNGWDNSDNAEFILSTEESEGQAEGYVYLTAGEIKLVTDHSWDNDHTYGDDGSGNLTNPGNNITVAEDGYYLIQANLTNMTYLLVKTEWGVIGAATPNGWDDETALEYNSASATWKGFIHLTAAEMKFRANHDWGYNYGSDLADGTLGSDQANIAVSVESDYAVELNLSTPNEYTYSLNRWGLIGDATPNGWDSDQNFTYDAVNEAWTLTVDLTVGGIKFRANDDWAINYGDNDVDGTLELDGANISVTEAGNYTITMTTDYSSYSIVKN
jgi:hypothetical protein